ncbi:MAG: CDP-alcohol phosphatidyltransferase family protein [Chloroflexi bacterium]|nr:CDP-alcohol phosphatidyltransferase family protein [Chloroflexota bacterium]
MAPVGRTLGSTGITPNALTAIGLGLNVGAAVVLATGQYTWGGLAFLGASAFDALDGAVARATGQASPFGAFFDSVADRYAESVVFIGLFVSFSLQSTPTLLAAAVIALVGSLMVSYTRARAEGLGVDCEVGLLQRPERVLLLTAGLLVPDLLLQPVLWGLALATNITVVQRVLHVRKALQARARGAQGDSV